MARSTKNRLKSLLEAIQTRLRTIAVGTYFNNTLASGQVEIGYKSIDECNKFPHIYIASVTEGPSIPVRRTQFENRLECEIFGYVKSTREALEEALKLQSDMEQSLCADESFGSKATRLSIRSEVAAMKEHGVVHMIVYLDSQYEEE